MSFQVLKYKFSCKFLDTEIEKNYLNCKKVFECYKENCWSADQWVIQFLQIFCASRFAVKFVSKAIKTTELKSVCRGFETPFYRHPLFSQPKNQIFMAFFKKEHLYIHQQAEFLFEIIIQVSNKLKKIL